MIIFPVKFGMKETDVGLSLGEILKNHILKNLLFSLLSFEFYNCQSLSHNMDVTFAISEC